MKNLSGKVAAITGAASGMGREIAILLAKEGCCLALSDMNKEGLAETAELAAFDNIKISQHELDVSNKDAVYCFADDVVKEHSTVNIIINNAGVGLTAGVETMEYSDFEWIMNINFWGVVYGTKAFLPYIKKTGEGRIVNISSVFGLVGIPTQSAYCATKFAVRGFTESLQQELELIEGDIMAISVHPGGIKTNIMHGSRIEASNNLVGEKEKAVAKFDKIAQTSAHEAALQILNAIKKNSKRLLIGKDARMIDRFQRLFPSYYQTIMLNKNKKFKALRKKMKGK
ncbi:MAG: SDR family oxidoreductase [bacterium]|nr:SDR family oxidoreductase [bacterium]